MVNTTDVAEQFWARADRTQSHGCWIWVGTIDQHGYGDFEVRSERWLAHRYAYELLVGPIPDGLHLDHVCHTTDDRCQGGRSCLHRRCVNPAHLEAVTPQENCRRASLRVGKCKRGHAMHGDNLMISGTRRQRLCRTCKNMRARQDYRRRTCTAE